MKISNQDIEDSKQNRATFNKNYDDAVISVLALKNDCNMSIKDIQDFTKYEINFIVHVIDAYDKMNVKTKIDAYDKMDMKKNEYENHINLRNIIMMGLLT